MDSLSPLPPPLPSTDEPPLIKERPAPRRVTYWLTRFMLLRLLELVYLVAFLVAAHQIVPLIGHDGLTPMDKPFHRLAQTSTAWERWSQVPTLFHLSISDSALQSAAWVGVALSAVVLAGYANGLIMLALWVLYTSFVNAGGLWYGYGWESQLLETGFLAIFLCPLLDGRPFARRTPPVAVIWLYRWLIFRIMLGAGLIKMRGDACWRDLTALYYHYETQPVPNPFSRTLHFAPHWFQRFSVWWNFFIELYVPWVIVLSRIPGLECAARRLDVTQHLRGWCEWTARGLNFTLQHLRQLAGLLMGSFQVILIVSGNLSFLNWLTLIPCLACLDDSFWRLILPGFLKRRAVRAEAEARPSLLAGVTTALLLGVRDKKVPER